jgi:D-alanine-D-alanine ligase
MRIGLTYDLRDDYLAEGYSEDDVAEFDSVSTIDELEAALSRLGFAVERIGNIKTLAAKLVAGERWDFVFNIAEGLAGRSREAQVPALLEAYGVPYTFSDPLVLALTLDKAVAKRVVRDHGIPTTPFAVIETAADIALVELPYPLFAKPLAEGTGKGVDVRSKITDELSLNAVCRDLLRKYKQPVLVETYLQGREFTVGITGTGPSAKAIAVMEVVLLANAEQGVYSYVNKEQCETLVHYGLATDAEARLAGKTALEAYRALDCRDGGRVDLRSDAAHVPHFMEVNPLAGIHPTHSDLPILAGLAGVSYDTLIWAIVSSCLGRNGLVFERAEQDSKASVA